MSKQPEPRLGPVNLTNDIGNLSISVVTNELWDHGMKFEARQIYANFMHDQANMGNLIHFIIMA